MIVQETIAATWEALHEGRVRGAEGKAAAWALRGFARETAWRHAMNYARLGSTRNEIPMSACNPPPPEPTTPDPMPGIEARDALRRVEGKRPLTVQALLLAAVGVTVTEGGEAVGLSRAGYQARVQKGRDALRKLGAAPPPKQPPRPTWKTRKAKR